jgi:DnaJ domain
MTDLSAVKIAVSVLHLPASLRRVRSEPLPTGVDVVLRIAAGDAEAEHAAAEFLERSPAVIRQAAVFYIEQVLFSPDSNNYRVLGATPDASPQDLRRNMALLMTWLHPDKNPSGERAVLAGRVTAAWDSLRSPDRRAAYDASLLASQARASSSKAVRSAGHRLRRAARPPHLPDPQRQDLTRMEEHHGLLSRGWCYLRRVLRERSQPRPRVLASAKKPK